MNTLSNLMSLSGRCAMITGGAGHLGIIMAETLAELGADLVLVDLPTERLNILADRISQQYFVGVTTVTCDLEIEKERSVVIDSLVSREKKLDILINNAAFVGTSSLRGWGVPFESQSIETWRRAFEVNLTAVFHLCQGLMPLLRQSAHGSIVNIGSIYGELGPDWDLYAGTTMGNAAAYGASKGGLFQFTRWLATTVAPEVRVNAISPGGIARGQDDRFVSKYNSRTPLRRMATEEDFRGIIALLAGDASSYITGQIIRVDGGWSSW